ncbi:LysR family transcriptional regulator [Streptomyces tropicalis]|uniref:LysR family transcriptional regulator n=1 Tax=Streptomyces tropicalis TaxID=3034234 RepID=A0ABT6A1T4_9ACTN|nr:LysR family transcriptional regulator [Streptomyces tropicalis]MDF3298603.1 LysR family transcriptional regulator [Streptomyces tropicalis]
MDLLAHLEAYVAAVDEASFSRAADRLGIAQPLLSRRIKTLEEHFGGLLFDRSRRQVATTELGVLLLPYAQDVLDRAQRLRQAAESAGRSAVRAVAVPADCGPDALARVIRAGADRGTVLGVHELPPDARAAGLTDGSLTYALLRVPPEHAALRVPLGLASAPAAVGRGAAGSPHAEDHPLGPVGADGPDGGAVPGGRDDAVGPGSADGADGHGGPGVTVGRGTPHASLVPGAPLVPGGRAARRAGGPRPVHLENLRPRRTPGTSRRPPAPLPLLTLPEDQVAHAQDWLERATVRAGLPEGLLRPAAATATALAETLAGRATLLCTEPFARRHGASWAPLADVSLHRGYDPAAAPRPHGEARVPDWLLPLLAAAVGAAVAPPAPRASRPAGDEASARLAARG